MSDNRKRRRCGECQQCSAEDCGVCRFCIDKKKFGGPDKLKQCCIKRRCKIIKGEIIIIIYNCADIFECSFKVGGKDDPVLFKLDGHELTYSDLNCIWIGEWLNDKVCINIILKIVTEYS